MNILGIDPGTASLGYGVIKKEQKLTCLEYGVVKTDKELEDAQRLKKIDEEMETIFEEHSPNVVAVEKVYFYKNVKSAFPVSQAKGIIMLRAAKNELPVHEFTPSQIKATVAGDGKAEKMQVQKMIKAQLKLKERPRPNDAADALGAAICGAQKLNQQF